MSTWKDSNIREITARSNIAPKPAPNRYTPRKYMTVYAGGTSPGYCKTLESATVAAVRKMLIHGFNACTIVCMNSGLDIVRLRLNDERTNVSIKTTKPWELLPKGIK